MSSEKQKFLTYNKSMAYSRENQIINPEGQFIKKM